MSVEGKVLREKLFCLIDRFGAVSTGIRDQERVFGGCVLVIEYDDTSGKPGC